MKRQTMSLARLIDAAIAARELAYAPYSNFRVGAALLDTDNRVFTGCNVENASYGLAICAERSAICAAVANGSREFQTLVVAAVPLATPCGPCRQFAVEFGKGLQVVSVNAENPDEQKAWLIEELIPESFSFERDAEA